ncbi:hypothetical protein L202_02454 [Cryptococcus amylolentus CBS 6039]|uniref:Uncharacterized protein n=2 Tax=Cryptococcus amylolentus TaxID=104669 RepID=A0A1E3I0N2_9TREE|nr:hypothetical protein L202_02454 [Cryptococcus amylolentus CBS 6039]ODN82160.1 hypothetical protein L202_02454 [Cryptococcus amylolentus CBS 6039]ODO09746.1 hypothetical protein I350_01963 [Cryptococcus amylolentus CBS 6273]
MPSTQPLPGPSSRQPPPPPLSLATATPRQHEATTAASFDPELEERNYDPPKSARSHTPTSSSAPSPLRSSIVAKQSSRALQMTAVYRSPSPTSPSKTDHRVPSGRRKSHSDLVQMIDKAQPGGRKPSSTAHLGARGRRISLSSNPSLRRPRLDDPLGPMSPSVLDAKAEKKPVEGYPFPDVIGQQSAPEPDAEERARVLEELQKEVQELKQSCTRYQTAYTTLEAWILNLLPPPPKAVQERLPFKLALFAATYFTLSTVEEAKTREYYRGFLASVGITPQFPVSIEALPPILVDAFYRALVVILNDIPPRPPNVSGRDYSLANLSYLDGFWFLIHSADHELLTILSESVEAAVVACHDEAQRFSLELLRDVLMRQMRIDPASREDSDIWKQTNNANRVKFFHAGLKLSEYNDPQRDQLGICRATSLVVEQAEKNLEEERKRRAKSQRREEAMREKEEARKRDEAAQEGEARRREEELSREGYEEFEPEDEEDAGAP